ncbi:hypothetical protein ACXR2W_00970 [Leucobacter sp. HY1908]
MVHVAGALPKGEANGLEAHSLALSKALGVGRKFYVVGVVETHSVKTGKDFVPVPTVAFTRVELVPFEHELETPAADLLVALSDVRRGGDGQQSFNLRGEAAPDMPVEPEVLELDSGGGMFFRVVDVEPGVFELRLCSQYVEGLLVRRLQRSDWGEVPPGDYQADQFDEALASFARVLLTEWETNGGEAVVDAEVVDDAEVEGGEVIDGVVWPAADDEAEATEGGDS